MTSYRKQINDAVQAQLLGKTVAGANVLTSLDRPLNPATDLPAVMIYSMSSRRGKEDYGRAVIPRVVTLGIEGAVKSTPGNEIGDAEALAEAIEEAMEADPTLGMLVNDCRWQQSMSDATSHGSHVMGVCLLQYEVEILTHHVADGANEFSDDGFLVPPTEVRTAPDAGANTDIYPPPTEAPGYAPGQACGPGGCDIPAWEGEVNP